MISATLNSRLLLLVAVLLSPLALLLTGCGNGGPALVPVSGTITIDGEPLADAAIMVYCEGGRPAMANSDAEGRFTLMTFEPDDGCVEGTHQVQVEACKPAGGSKLAYYAPPKYGDYKNSGLTLTVDGPTEDARLELTWDGKKGPIVIDEGQE